MNAKLLPFLSLRPRGDSTQEAGLSMIIPSIKPLLASIACSKTGHSNLWISAGWLLGSHTCDSGGNVTPQPLPSPENAYHLVQANALAPSAYGSTLFAMTRFANVFLAIQSTMFGGFTSQSSLPSLPPTVILDSALVTGFSEGGIDSFAGIPYGQPP